MHAPILAVVGLTKENNQCRGGKQWEQKMLGLTRKTNNSTVNNGAQSVLGLIKEKKQLGLTKEIKQC